MKYKVTTFIKTILQSLNQKQIGLSKGYMDWLMSEKVVTFQEYNQGFTEQWNMNIKDFNESGF